jgi:hypothetical protein
MRLSRAAFWAGVALTIALVAVGIWFYVRDDYPFQIDASEITGLVYHSVASGSPVSGYVGSPPDELAEWVSGMEKTSVAESSPATTVVTIVRSDGPSLRIAIDGSRGYASWVSPDGTVTPAIGLHLNASFVWYLRGIGDALATTRHGVTPRVAPSATGASPQASGSPLASASP